MATATPRKPLWVAVDTNVLLDLADGKENVWEAVDTIRQRLSGVQFVVPPTVVQELTWIVEHGDTARECRLALTAAQKLVPEWQFVPLNLIPVGHGITDQIAGELRRKGLLPDEEVNDSLIVAESALAACKILLSSDTHVATIPADKLALILAEADVETVLISRPRDIARKFGR
jgi:predicted nucleic acid-binding protein